MQLPGPFSNAKEGKLKQLTCQCVYQWHASFCIVFSTDVHAFDLFSRNIIYNSVLLLCLFVGYCVTYFITKWFFLCNFRHWLNWSFYILMMDKIVISIFEWKNSVWINFFYVSFWVRFIYTYIKKITLFCKSIDIYIL